MDDDLSQDEVDDLLSAVAGEDSEQAVDKEGNSIIKYDLANQDKIIRCRLPTLDIIHDRFIRLFRASLSNSLRKLANISVNSTGPLKFSEFMNSLPLPSCLNILKLDPLRGSAIMVVEAKLLYALVDSLFGGNDVPYTKIEGKDFTPIELKIAKRIVLSAIGDIEKAWEPIYPLKFGYLRTEINPQHVTVLPPSDVVIATTFDVELEKVTGTIKLVLPYSSLEPIKSKLSVGFQSEQFEIDHTWINRIKSRIMDVEVDCKVNLGDAQITMEDITNLETGDVIQLNRDASSPLDLEVEGVKKFRGHPGVVHGQKALRITEVIDEE